MLVADNPRYSRQVSLAGFGIQGQQSLSNAHVLCVGAGGLGSPVALYLAAAGVGRLTIVDDDVVDLSNLQRQILHSSGSVGRPKVESAALRLKDLNPECEVTAINSRFSWPSCIDVCRDVDVIVDGSDNFDTRYVVSSTAVRLGIPHVWGSILGFDAQMSVFNALSGPIYEDVFPQPPLPGDVPNCAEAGVLGPLVGTIGSAMALEAIKLIADIGTPLVGSIGYFDGLTGRWEYIPITANPDVKRAVKGSIPRHMPAVTEISSLSEASFSALIDVREPAETALGVIPGAQIVPLSLIEKDIDAAQTLVPSGAVLYCAAGVRSARAGILLTRAGTTNLMSLAGGYNRWVLSNTD
ncbi:ThiF family adenylyltransferase [Corynebacterium diphtheriae]|uniref:ThiF family adenylyltransferase n=1 Tax=Corynebacterium diphtheriae TaxID=1717 RepID=UPI000245B1E4|nr:ThiF family adenylyltransferase [Corynebacterium diphtheriae]AEX45716.1 molybdopterin biosynthesis protein [Corynebacterium diphtheriae INCA 402]APM36841.1 molybdopterin biosynthesis protein MoeB [Corynebacterium diphtheriae]AWR15171.1 molybdopterin biosynthesis protein [Corynebacterium diphtheriae]MBG9371562.1 ThiF family adenylyltransferase [Corynebacterium diphtheriae bv. mitis]OFI51472.1 molybdopterin biosynthesis protein MoeB [Corynebacterium diphtheriae]